MFSNLFFFFLVFVLISFAADIPYPAWVESPELGFAAGLALYILFLAFLYLQNKLFKRSKWAHHTSLLSGCVNIEFMFFFCLYQWILGAQRIFSSWSLLDHSQVGAFLAPFILYFSTLLWHYTFFFFNQGYPFREASTQARKQIQLLLPFSLPALLFSVSWDVLSSFPTLPPLISYLFLGILALLTFLGMPLLMIKLWDCQPLTDPRILPKLETVCHFFQFKHGGIRVWNVLNRLMTAGIIGVIPSFRYIMFSPKILHRCSPEELEAILTHEIGHSLHKHLLYYPFILMGMVVSSSLAAFLYQESLWHYFNEYNQLYPSEIWSLLYLLSFFALYALTLALYFRLVFGFFSRLFERQADLQVFEYHLTPTYLIHALNHIAVASGNTHRQPSWHHFSIQQRIDFLLAAKSHPFLIAKHHQKVRRCLGVYFLLLIVATLSLFYLL